MSFAAIAIGIAAVGAGVTAYAAKSSADAQQAQAKYNEQVAANNAGAEAQQGKFNAQQIDDKTRRNVANQRAAMAASGFDANTGTFTDVTSDTKRQGELDKLSSIYSAKMGMTYSQNQAQLSGMEGSYDQTAGDIGVMSSIIGGASQATTIATNPAFRN
jgi:hypothetical protein